MNRTPPNETAEGAAGGANGPPTNPRRQNPVGPVVNRGDDVRAALETAAEEARATALDQQVQAMQAQGPSILAALDSQTTNKVPRWGATPGDFSAELWFNQVEMLRTMNKWTEEQTKEACFLSMEGAAATWKQATLRDEGTAALATFPLFKEAFLKRFKKLKTPAESCLLYTSPSPRDS